MQNCGAVLKVSLTFNHDILRRYYVQAAFVAAQMRQAQTLVLRNVEANKGHGAALQSQCKRRLSSFNKERFRKPVLGGRGSDHSSWELYKKSGGPGGL